MNIVTKLVVMGCLMGLVGCVSGPKPRDPDPNNPASVKPTENPMPPPVTRISPEDVTEENARAIASELGRNLSVELEQLNTPQVAER